MKMSPADAVAILSKAERKLLLDQFQLRAG